MSRANVADFYKTDLALTPEIAAPNIDDEIGQSLSRLMAWYPAGNYFRRVACDVDGRLYITMSGVPILSPVYGATAVASTALKVIATNPNRRKFLLQNLGPNDCYMGFDGNLTTSLGILIPNGAVYTDDTYIGDIFMICIAAQSADIRWQVF